MGFKGWENFDPAAEKKDPRRQTQGYLNREVGETFEEYIKAACAYYRIRGFAEVDKTPEPFKVTSGRHKNQGGMFVFEGVFTKQAQPDFQGTLKGGRSVVFEAKTSTSDRIEQSVVTSEQKRALISHEKLGAWAYVMVSLSLRSFYRIPWVVWSEMKERFGHKYMTAEELSLYAVPMRNGILLIFD